MNPLPALRAVCSFTMALTLLGTSVIASAVEWPEDHEIMKDTISSNGRFGIAVTNDRQETMEIDYLVDIKQHQVLAEIPGVPSFKNAKLRSLTADWADSGNWCVANYGGRSGFSQLILLHLADGQWSVTELGRHVNEVAHRVLSSTKTPLHFWLGADSNDGILHFYASGNDNAKAAEGVDTHCAVFSGRYDMKTGEWVSSVAKSIDRDDELILFYDQHADLPDESREQWQARMDRQLNEVYGRLKRHLPPERFEKLQAEQRGWVAEIGKTGSPAKEIIRLAIRLHELRDVLAQTLAEGT